MTTVTSLSDRTEPMRMVPIREYILGIAKIDKGTMKKNAAKNPIRAIHSLHSLASIVMPLTETCEATTPYDEVEP